VYLSGLAFWGTCNSGGGGLLVPWYMSKEGGGAAEKDRSGRMEEEGRVEVDGPAALK